MCQCPWTTGAQHPIATLEPIEAPAVIEHDLHPAVVEVLMADHGTLKNASTATAAILTESFVTEQPAVEMPPAFESTAACRQTTSRRGIQVLS